MPVILHVFQRHPDLMLIILKHGQSAHVSDPYLYEACWAWVYFC